MKKEEHKGPAYYENNPKAHAHKPEKKDRKAAGSRVKIQQYFNGQLVVTDYFYEKLEEALEYAKSKKAEIVKVYNEYDEVVYSSAGTPKNTYA